VRIAGGWPLASVLAGAVAALAWRRQSLTADGALAATGVGTVVFALGGVPAALALLVFFVTSSALSHLHQARAASVPQAKGARRDAWQVLANGGPATLLLALGEPGGFVGALATAAADTWATEIGMRAGRAPRSILTLRRVAPGTSGGVTPEGTLAGILGSLAVGLSFVLASPHARQRPFFAPMASGLAGCVLDSVLGATLQALYRCPACDVVLESPRHAACGTQAKLVRGWSIINNDAVNAIATTFGGVLGTRLMPGPMLPTFAWIRSTTTSNGMSR
jgi:uncharacterized protein (TIGR00297 family)